jgi:hypothetical protein
MVLRDHATKVSIQLLNVNAHKITINKFGSLNETHRLMIKPGLAFVSTSRHTNFRTFVRVLLYGHVVYISSCSLVLVSWHERVTTVGNFYTEDANARLNWQIELFQHKTTIGNHGVRG